MGTKKAATAAKKNEKETEVQLPDLVVKRVYVTVKGDSPLICHRWSEKAKKEMLDRQMKKATKVKKAKDPDEDYRESLYVLPDGDGYGFPSVAFKAAMVRAGTYVGMKMTFLRGVMHIPGELVKIDGEPRKREDMVRLQGKTADIRYRGEFPEWQATIPIDYSAEAITLEQILNLMRHAGFSVGVGEWRPERNGQYGRFSLVGAETNDDEGAERAQKAA